MLRLISTLVFLNVLILPYLLCSAESLKPTLQPRSCAEALQYDGQSGVYQLHLPESDLKPFYVYCLKDPDNGAAWTIIQRRQDGSVDFYRDWQSYKYGFGNLEGEHFLGLEIIHALTNSQLHELWIEMKDFEGGQRLAKYDTFAIGNDFLKYPLSVLGKYSGNAGDSLINHVGQAFTTNDADNSRRNAELNCAVKYTGAWWYGYVNCHFSNLNGQYMGGKYDKENFAKGVNWKTWQGYYYSLKYVHMAIRPK